MGKAKSGALDRGRGKKTFLYRQLSTILRERIGSGEYAPGDRIPSMDDLARDFKLNKVTVRSALSELTAEGLIHSIPAKGTFVVEGGATPVASLPDTLTIGLVSPQMYPNQTGPYHIELVENIRHELASIQANLMVLPAAVVKPQAQLVAMTKAAGLHAAIHIGPFEPLVLRKLATVEVPSVVIDHVIPGLRMDAVAVDNHLGASQAVSHLLELGHDRIAVIAGVREQQTTKERLRGAKEAYAEASGTSGEPIILYADFQTEGGFEAMKRLLGARARPTGVFCMNDEMAAGAVRACLEEGVRVPEEVSIVGFDDVSLATVVHPQLTSVRSPRDVMAKLAVEYLQERLRDPGRVPVTSVLATTLIPRGSTAARRGR